MRRKALSTMLVTGVAAVAAVSPASAQPQVGLVNVNIEDNTVVVPINAAANICGVNVTVLSAFLDDAGQQVFTECRARSGRDVTVTG